MGGPRRKIISPLVQWHVARTPAGTLVIRDTDGNDPFHDPNPLTSMCNMYVAAGGPFLKQALQVILKRYQWSGAPYGKDDEITHLSLTALGATVPSIYEIVRADKFRQQAELRLEAA